MKTIKPPIDPDYDIALFDRNGRFLYVKFQGNEGFSVPKTETLHPLELRKLPDFLSLVPGHDCGNVTIPMVGILTYLVKTDNTPTP